MISIKNTALRRGSKLLFSDLSLQIHRSERVGIVGINGCGKSSFLEMIRGEISADQGEIQIPEQIAMAFVSQNTPSADQASLEYVLDGDTVLRSIEAALDRSEGKEIAAWHEQMAHIDGYSAPARAARLMRGLGFSESALKVPTNALSGGWRVRLNLARALMCPSDLLLLDEPTNHLDLDAVIWLEEWLKRYRGTILVISHDRDFLDAICTRILHVENCSILSYKGNYSAFETIRAERIASDQAAYEKQQRAINHMRDYVRRFRAKATKARQAQSRLKALERMQLVAPAHADSPFHFGFLDPPAASDPLLKLIEVGAGYDSVTVLKKVSISIGTQDRIALLGHNGAGKSTLIKLLAGEIEPENGEIIRAKGLRVGYFAQHQLEQLNPDSTPMQQMIATFPERKTQELRDFLGSYGFGGERVDTKIGPFSGGEKARLALALLICRGPNLLLMDEPTNHLDLEMRHALTLAFQNYQGAVLLVSHDRHLIKTVTDQLWLVHDNDVQPFQNDIDGYINWTREDRLHQSTTYMDSVSAQSGTSVPSKRARRQQSAKLRQQLKPLTLELKQIERWITRTEHEIQDLEEVLSNPTTFETESTANLAAMMQSKSKLEKDLESLEAQWLDLAEQLESVNLALTDR